MNEKQKFIAEIREAANTLANDTNEKLLFKWGTLTVKIPANKEQLFAVANKYENMSRHLSGMKRAKYDERNHVPTPVQVGRVYAVGGRQVCITGVTGRHTAYYGKRLTLHGLWVDNGVLTKEPFSMDLADFKAAKYKQLFSH
jgi:hypothetical protein